MGFLGAVIAGGATWLLWDNGWPLITVSIIVAVGLLITGLVL